MPLPEKKHLKSLRKKWIWVMLFLGWKEWLKKRRISIYITTVVVIYIKYDWSISNSCFW